MATERGSPPPDLEATENLAAGHELRSFRMDRKSPEAGRLRAAVSQKLCEFLGNYSDEVLAEYIVVLVCNGKHQNQARDDLEAFLGDESQRFVSWLWDYLSNQVAVKKPPVVNADLTTIKAEKPDQFDKDQKTRSPRILRASDSAERSEAQACGVHSKLSLSFDKHNEAKRDWHSSPSNSPETLSGSEQCRQYMSQHQKIIKSNSGAVLCESSCMANTSSVSRNFQPSAKENSQSRLQTARSAAPRSLYSDFIDVEEVPQPQPQGNVWDRLGKPCKDDGKSFRGKGYHHGHHGIKREILRGHEVEFRGSRAVLVEQDAELLANVPSAAFNNVSSRIISQNHADIYRSMASNIQGSFDDLEKLERKRKFGDIDCGKSSASFYASEGEHLDRERLILRKKGPLRSNYDSLVKNSLTETAVLPDSSPSLKSSGLEYRLQSQEVARSQPISQSVLTSSGQDQVLHDSSALAKSEPTKDSTGNDKNKPMQEEIIDLKSKLLQVEMNMQKLRAKRANMNLKINVPSGPKGHLDEDVDSRTVFVTNVHFAASREALISHFAKCGPIVKATILTDTVTAQPKGAAFIVFVSKESVDKAISMSGISFFSRILTVVRKTEMPQGFMTPTKPAVKTLHPWSTQLCKGSLVRQQSSSHLQWRREEITSRENSLPAASDGFTDS